jgi:hypothetical protein
MPFLQARVFWNVFIFRLQNVVSIQYSRLKKVNKDEKNIFSL